MRARTFLRRAEQLHAAIQIKREQIACMRQALTELTIPTDKERVSHTAELSPVESAIIRVEELEIQLEMEIAHYFNVQQEITQVINRLESVFFRSMLTKHYILFEPWSVIAEELGLSDKWLFNQHSRALKKVEQILAAMDIPESSGNHGKLPANESMAATPTKP